MAARSMLERPSRSFRTRLIAGCGSLSLLLPLAAARAEEIVAWGATVTVSGGGWGRMARLQDARWLSVNTEFPAGEPSRLRIHRGTESARSWIRVTDVVEPGRKFDNGNLAVLRDGSVLLAGRSLIDGESYRLPVHRSLDGGRTWKPMSNVDSSEGPPGTREGKGLWEPYLFVLADGTVTMMYSNEKHAGYSQIISQKTSSDGGATWGPEIRAVEEPGGGRLRPGMPVLARMADGRYIVVYEVVGIGNADVYFKISRDGEHWDNGLGSPIPDQHCGPFVVSATDGRLFVSSCENRVSMSEDFGSSWVVVDPPPWDLGFAFSWPALYEIREGELGAMVTAAGGVKLRFGALEPRDPTPGYFRRGDANGDRLMDISDPVSVLASLFLNGQDPVCRDAADLNDDGAIDVSDAVYGLQWLFGGGVAPPHPFPGCAWDLTADPLDCGGYLGCR